MPNGHCIPPLSPTPAISFLSAMRARVSSSWRLRCRVLIDVETQLLGNVAVFVLGLLFDLLMVYFYCLNFKTATPSEIRIARIASAFSNVQRPLALPS